jgi:hypothetical protein
VDVVADPERGGLRGTGVNRLLHSGREAALERLAVPVRAIVASTPASA